MRILDSHEFIELYRGHKDLILGYLLSKKYNDEYIFLCPKINSYADEKLFNQKYFQINNVEKILGYIPENLKFVFYSSIRLYKKIIYFKKVESTNFFQIPIGYISKVKKIKPDIIFESNYTTLTPRSYLNFIASKLFNIPVVWIDCADGGRMMAFRWIEKIVANNVSKIITYSNGGKERLINKYNLDPNKIIVKPKPIDLDKFVFTERSTNKKIFNIGYVGRLAENKGFDTFIDIACRYIKNKQLGFTAIGEFTSEFEREKLIPRIPQNLKLMGHISNKDMPLQYSKIDLIVIPNMTNPPAFTTVLAESIASGIPCIVGIKGYEQYIPVSEQDACFIVNPKNVGEISKLIDVLIDMPLQDYNELKKKARKFAEKELSWVTQLPFYRKVFAEAIAMHR
ncbi:MAG: glycosyltransferase [Caloramator sp.]|jgi:glycosyltransferase involved in cell wall biosynthesis|uniref:glycosyltransferase family 4 protein n=1 Tax=Caloramator sp. TaxID=1871330 RepID=UPI001D6C0880|nr:glycosyltransferase [Caloramator sp.]MBZ4664630.1 glycosyltransferase [Caloramator sp.]